MEHESRMFLPEFAELLDRLTIDQIKEVLLPNTKQSVAEEMLKIGHDIDLMIKERKLQFSSSIVRIIIALSQLNLFIWNIKDNMKSDTKHYDELLKKAHQLNGIRNQLKNRLLEEAGDKEKSSQRTNYNVDGLTGWDISVLSM